MFEDSLVESSGRIRTRSRWYAIGSFALQTILLGVIVLIPYLYPAALPKEAISILLAAPPPPPPAPAPMPHVEAARAAAPIEVIGLRAPTLIPRRILDESSTPPAPAMDPAFHSGSEVNAAMSLLGRLPPPPVVARPRPQGPVRISAGVAAGRLLEPIRPVYPAIARSARVQGTVVIEAIISKDGRVKDAHVVSGPALLTQAALDAVSRARYAPFKLSGEAVDVDTSINIVFTLGE